MTATCRGCRFPGVLVDTAGICHDCHLAMQEDPTLTIEDLRFVMPGPEW